MQLMRNICIESESVISHQIGRKKGKEGFFLSQSSFYCSKTLWFGTNYIFLWEKVNSNHYPLWNKVFWMRGLDIMSVAFIRITQIKDEPVKLTTEVYWYFLQCIKSEKLVPGGLICQLRWHVAMNKL